MDSGLRFQKDLIFEFKGRSYEFEIDEQDFSTGMAVSVKANADQYALQITSLTNDVAKYHIHIKDEPASTSVRTCAPGDEAFRLTFSIDCKPVECFSWVRQPCFAVQAKPDENQPDFPPE